MEVSPTSGPFPLGAYGKLPFSKEYLREECFSGTPGQFKQWLDLGVERKGATGLSAPYSVLFRPATGEKALVGTLQPGASTITLRGMVPDRADVEQQFEEIESIISTLSPVR